MKVFYAFAFYAFIALPALAAGPTNPNSPNDGSDSCGLGWQVTDKKSFLATTTRATTNAVVHPSFGMTSGTMGCEKHDFAKAEQDAVIYAATNSESLSIEMAEGRGEFLSAFASSMGCSEDVIPAFSSMTQKNYQQITNGAANGIELYRNVKKQVAKDPVLSASCKTSV